VLKGLVFLRLERTSQFIPVQKEWRFSLILFDVYLSSALILDSEDTLGITTRHAPI
jgi:hypothetical protein